jgi:SPP1 family predicted phage head-tail adaptor
LDRVVSLQKWTDSRTPSGGVVRTWTEFARVFAGKRDTLGSERVAAGVEQTTADSVYRIRWRPDLTTTTRLIYKENAWDVTSIAELGGRERFLDLTCRRVTV